MRHSLPNRYNNINMFTSFGCVHAAAVVVIVISDYAQDTIDELHKKGKRVSCYISVGAVESWREDADEFPSSVVGESSDLEGEKYLDITQQVHDMT